MATDVKSLVAAINPEVFCDKSVKDEVKKIAKEKGYLEAAKKAKMKEPDYLDVPFTRNTVGAYKLVGIKNPIEQHKLVYDEFSQNMEPVYFWILDYINKEYGSAEKLIDNFISSPGSGVFSEMNKKMTVLQEEGMKIFQTVNTVLRSILNIIYDLKEFKLRLAEYENYKSSDPKIRFAAMLGLKQVWMDSVDIKRQTSSLKGFAQQFDYVTLIDAFMASNSLEDVDKLDLNDRVKRILQQRIPEFFRWVEESERELKKRFEIEKIYLKSQANSVKLYARWLKPYLKAAKQLEQNASETADLVTFFNTALFELVLLAKDKYDPEGDIQRGELPELFKKPSVKKMLRKYIPMTLVEFSYRTVPDRNDQRGGYGYRGKVEIVFTSFALNEDELKVLKREIEKDDIKDVYKTIMGATDDSLGQIDTDIAELLGEKVEKGEEKKEEPAWFSFKSLFTNEKKKEEVNLAKEGMTRKDNDYEKYLRSQALLDARFSCRKFYDSYKKSLGMSAFPPSAY